MGGGNGKREPINSRCMIDTAFILVGGEGLRLRPLTNKVPKTMIELAGKPLLVWEFEWLKKHGIKNVILAVCYKHHIIRKYLGDTYLGLKIQYSLGDISMSTGGALKLAAKRYLPDHSEHFLVLNGDTICDADLSAMADYHKGTNPFATILTINPKLPWDILAVKDKKVKKYKSRPILNLHTNTGVYIYSRDVFKFLPDEGEQEPTIFPMCKDYQIHVFHHKGFWRAVDTLKDKNEAEKFLANQL